MQITAINTTIMFIDDECKCECKCEPQKANVITNPEIKPKMAEKSEDKPKLKEPLKQDTIEIKKPEAKCEGDACKCPDGNCK